MKRIAGNSKLSLEIAGLFLKDCTRLLGDMPTRIAPADSARLTQPAHTFQAAVRRLNRGLTEFLPELVRP